ncbi:MAG: SUMF1/EgtB/PvdO family nonheme iron enzyme [Deltaproteobacteria bacterium]|nr:SUMF1/EgtB/PvdO family nonheme iron enzyme [Deltaproteobacteria bacterium]
MRVTLPPKPPVPDGGCIDPVTGNNNCGPGNPPPTDFTPAHAVTLSPFFIDRYAVTNEQYLACFNAGVCPDETHGGGGDFYEQYHLADPRLAKYPMSTLASHEAAEAYCTWMGRRLPTV